jgi:glycosyltransferase involved in cell wall biosynthesis
MRIAVNAWFWSRPDTGSGQYTQRLVEHLVALEPGLEVVLVASAGWAQATSKFHAPHDGQLETWNPKPATNNLKKVWFEQFAFPRACRHLEADVAHVPYWAPPLAPPVPTAVTIHDLIPLVLREYRGGPLVRTYSSLVAAAAQSAALVLTDSTASRQDILAHLDLHADKVWVIPLAAGNRYQSKPTPGEEQIRAGYGLPPCYILYLGSFDIRKNAATALRSYTWAGPVIGKDCPLAVAGRLPARDTPFAPDPRRQAQELGLEPDWVQFTGPVREKDKPALYRGAIALLFPSRYEGFGLPALEAMSCGTPVVGSDATSIPEVVGDAGVLLDPDDAEGMAGALIQLAHDPDFRAELSQRALAQAARFSWERTARETLAAYRKVLL